ncbi:Atlastin [Aphelenchoides besseyi]|nr:Atlastin [Aphelenchoides besseyi]KAI6223992.1 Atlastin [Aphelenchoides besseyi]
MTGISKLAKIEGQPLKIVKIEGNVIKRALGLEKFNTFGYGKSKCVFNLKSLIEILNKLENANEKICVLDITGKFRGGKSFLLTCIIRYLEWLEAGSPTDVDWINIPCDGFKSRFGTKRETTGIDIWPKLYTVKASNGSNLKILLVDTQGLFDNQTDMQSCGAIFGIAALLSSVMIYNIKECIGGVDVTNLASLVDFANEVASREGRRPLQKLMFLVRDFPFVNADRGFEAGNDYLIEVREEANENAEATAAWNLLDRASEEVVGCCLSPPDGSGIPDGNVAEMGDKFGRELRSFIEQLISDLEANMTCAQFVTDLESMPEVFTDGSLPEVDDVYQARVTKRLEIVCRKIIGPFSEVVKAEADGREDFRSCYGTHATEALAQFEKQSATIGEPQHRQMAAQQLREEMGKVYDRFNEKNKMNLDRKKIEEEMEKMRKENEKRDQEHKEKMAELDQKLKDAKTEEERGTVQSLIELLTIQFVYQMRVFEKRWEEMEAALREARANERKRAEAKKDGICSIM